MKIHIVANKDESEKVSNVVKKLGLYATVCTQGEQIHAFVSETPPYKYSWKTNRMSGA